MPRSIQTAVATAADKPLRARLGASPFDVIVVGAGINGAAIARDAALRGLRVLIVDKCDVGGGTSSWSSRLIHGGLRYLEHYDLRLVRESLRERELLLRMAPHLVEPIGFLIPHYPHNKRSAKLVELGMVAYDVLSFDKSVPWHRPLSRARTLKRFSGANQSGLRGAALYFDAQAAYPERLCVENLVSAVEAGALQSMWTQARGLIVEQGHVVGVSLLDVVTGDEAVARGRVVVNACGPWVDSLLSGAATSEGKQDRLIGGTKGSHLIVERFPGAPTDVVYYEAGSDNRLVLVIPWNGKILIGTTDTRYEGSPDDVRADLGEVDYLLRETNRLIPTAALTRESVLFTYSGVRPLPWTPPGTDAGSVTRNHHIVQSAELEGLLSIVGGKLTTYRALAEEAVDAVCRRLGVTSPACATARVPLPGARTADWSAFQARFLDDHSDRPMLARRLLAVYGTRADAVMDLAATSPELGRPLGGRLDTVAAEISWAASAEHARTLADVLMRRTMLGFDAALAQDVVQDSVRVLAVQQGWGHGRVEAELDAFWEAASRLQPMGAPPAAVTA